MINNEGRVAVIFGIRDKFSIAWEIAKKLHESGCKLACTYLDSTKDEVLSLLKEHNINTDLCGSVDVTNEEEIKDYADFVYSKAGSVHYLLHAVAFGSAKVLCVNYPGEEPETPRTYINMPFEDVSQAMHVSAYSLLSISRAFEPYLVKKESSILALTYGASQRLVSSYAGMAICKAALENISMGLADYFGPKKIRVNCLSPGMIMTSSSGGIKGIRKMRSNSKETSILGNVKAADVAGAALYYFSDLSKKITASVHYVDGGINKVLIR